MQRITCENRHEGKKCTTVTAQRVISILRVSSKKQQRDGEGIENQRRANNEYIKGNEYVLVREIVIAESASKDYSERFDLQEAINFILTMKKEGKVNAVVFYKSNRLSRAGGGEYFMVKALLNKHGLRVEYSTEHIDDSASGELLEHVLAGIARFDNRTRTEFTINTEKILTQQGYWCRPAPTGFENGRENDDPKGKPVLKPTKDRYQWDLLCYGLRKQMTGQYTITEVAAELREKGFITRKYNAKDGTPKGQNPLSHQTWYKISCNPIYGGLIGGKWIEGEPIRAKFDGALTPEEWWALQGALEKRKKSPMKIAHKKINPDFPLRKTLLCPRCGKVARGSRGRSKTGRYYHYYHCRDKACRFNIQTKDVHQLFEKLLQKITPSPELIRLFREIVLDVWTEKYKLQSQEVEKTQKEVDRLEAEKRRLVELMKSTDDSELLAMLQSQFSDASRQCQLQRAERAQKETEEIKAEVVVEYCVHFLLHAHKLWQKASAAEQLRVQSLIFPNGLNYDALTGRQSPELSPIYEAIEALEGCKVKLAAPRGIEPRFPG